MTVVASQLANPPPLTDPTAAGARRQELLQTSEYATAAAKGDAEKVDELAKLWRVEHGLPATPQPAVNTDDVFQQMNARALHEVETRADMLRADGLTDAQVNEVLNGRPMPAAERRWHEQELTRLKRDSAWVQKYFAGDVEARRQMRTHTAALTLPIGTLEEIKAWESAHPVPAK